MIATITQSMAAHPVIWALGGYYIVSAGISALPTPRMDKSSDFYKWFFQFSHVLAGNIGRIVATKGFPATQIKDVQPE